MKFGIFVCILVVLAVHGAVSVRGASRDMMPALVEGNCERKDLPGSALRQCASIKCEKTATGEISFSSILCPLSRCANGKELGHGPYDNSKPYPECCNDEKCD